MEIVYYPDLFLTSDRLIKGLLLTWGKVRTIVPPVQKEYVDSYLAGEITQETHLPLERYKEIYDAAEDQVVDFLVIADAERQRASEQMFDLIAHWNKDTGFYDSLKIKSLDDLMGKTVEWYWFLHEKLERDLVELMLEEALVVNWAPGEIMSYQDVGKSYMSIIADEVKRSRNVRLVTDDGFFMAAKAGLGLKRIENADQEGQYQLVTLAIPQVFISDKLLDRLTWKDIMTIRKDLLPLSEPYYREVEEYQNTINKFAQEGKDDEAFAKLCEFCERITKSFKPFSKEAGKLLRIVKGSDAIGMLNGIVLPTIKLLGSNPVIAKICDVAAISSTVGKYAMTDQSTRVGFEYLENLSRALNISRFNKMITCLVPKSLKELA